MNSTLITTIQSDGTWEIDYTTGGSDQNAAAITAFIIPLSALPYNTASYSEAAGVAVASVQVNR